MEKTFKKKIVITTKQNNRMPYSRDVPENPLQIPNL